MPLTYALVFLILAALAGGAAVAGREAVGRSALVFAWVSLGFQVLAAAYAGVGPTVAGAVRLLRGSRPGVRLNPAQRRAAEKKRSEGRGQKSEGRTPASESNRA